MIAKGVRILLDHDYDVTLNMILSDIIKGEEWYWRIFYVDAIKKGEKSGLDFRIDELSNNVGYSISWNELVNLSLDLIQLIDGIFIGSNNDDIRYSDPIRDMRKEYEYYFEIIDGGEWEIFTKDIIFYQKLISRYNCKVIKTYEDEN